MRTTRVSKSIPIWDQERELEGCSKSTRCESRIAGRKIGLDLMQFMTFALTFYEAQKSRAQSAKTFILNDFFFNVNKITKLGKIRNCNSGFDKKKST